MARRRWQASGDGEPERSAEQTEIEVAGRGEAEGAVERVDPIADPESDPRGDEDDRGDHMLDRLRRRSPSFFSSIDTMVAVWLARASKVARSTIVATFA